MKLNRMKRAVAGVSAVYLAALKSLVPMDLVAFKIKISNRTHLPTAVLMIIVVE